MSSDKNSVYNEYFIILENQLNYSLEVLRGDYFFYKNYIGLFLIVKVVYIKLKSEVSNSYYDDWHQISKINQDFSFGVINSEEYINKILYMINFEESKEIFFSNRHSSSVLREFIYNLDNLSLDKEYFTEKIAAEAFYSFVSKIFSQKGNMFFSEFSNEEIFSRVIQEIISVNKKELIFDPFIGSGGLLYKIFSQYTLGEVYLEGQDINALSLEICRLQFDLFGFSNFQLKHEDSLIDHISNYKKFDKIITQIPKKNFNRSFRTGSSSYYDYILDLVFYQLNSRGKAYIIVPSSFLYSEAKEKLIREQIISADVLETVIEFAGMGAQKNASNSALLIFNKKKEYYKKNKIQIIEFQEKEFNKLSQLIENYEESYKSRVIDLGRISKRTYNLTFKNFDPIFDEVKMMLHYGTAQRLVDVVEIIRPININNSALSSEIGIPVIRYSNLKRNLDEMYLDKKSYNDVLFYKEEYIQYKQLVDQKALILCIQGKDLRPTLFDPNYSTFKKIALTNHCIALTINNENTNLFTIEDLYFNFYNPNVIRQIEAFKRGTIVKRITYKDLLDVVIPNPEYEKQKHFSKYQEEPIRELERYRKLYEETLINLEQERIAAENKVVNMLIHNVSKHVSVVGHDIDKLEKFLYEQNLQDFIYAQEEIQNHNNSPEVRNGLREERTFVKIGDIVNITKERLNLIEKTFSDTQKSINLTLVEKDFEKIKIKSLLKEIKRDIGVNQFIPYEFEVSGEEVELYINQQSFKEMIHLLINNAEEHAFKKNNRELNYKIHFNVYKKNGDIVLEYFNNGLKFELSKEEFILAGRRSTDSNGSGLGGAYLNRVVTSHNGNFEIQNIDQGVKFIFIFNGRGRK